MVGINFQRTFPLCVLNYSFFKANHYLLCAALLWDVIFRSYSLFIYNTNCHLYGVLHRVQFLRYLVLLI